MEFCPGTFNRRISVFCFLSLMKSSVPYQFLVIGARIRWYAAPGLESWDETHAWISFSKHFTCAKNCLVCSTLFLEIAWIVFWPLWPLLIPCFLDNGCTSFGFLIFYVVKKFLVEQPVYSQKIIKSPLLHQELGSHVFLFLSPSGWSLGGVGNPPSSLSCSSFQDLLERTPCAFVSGANPLLGFIGFCVKQEY